MLREPLSLGSETTPSRSLGGGGGGEERVDARDVAADIAEEVD